jgi:hypothetical protein
MKALAVLLLIAALAAGLAAARPAAAQQQSDFEQRLEVRPVDPQEFVDRANRLAEGLWTVARGYSMPLLLVALALGSVLLLAGALLGRDVTRAGLGVIAAGLLGFILINYAPEVAGLAQALARAVVGGGVR